MTNKEPTAPPMMTTRYGISTKNDQNKRRVIAGYPSKKLRVRFSAGFRIFFESRKYKIRFPRRIGIAKPINNPNITTALAPYLERMYAYSLYFLKSTRFLTS
jgi:hypothetical protein